MTWFQLHSLPIQLKRSKFDIDELSFIVRFQQTAQERGAIPSIQYIVTMSTTVKIQKVNSIVYMTCQAFLHANILLFQNLILFLNQYRCIDYLLTVLLDAPHGPKTSSLHLLIGQGCVSQKHGQVNMVTSFVITVQFNDLSISQSHRFNKVA